MEDAEHGSPVEKILGTKDLVGEIMLKLGSSKSMISLSAVSKRCLAAKRNPGLLPRFAEMNKAGFLGFLVSFKQMRAPKTSRFRLVYDADSRVDESAVALRPRIKIASLAVENILCSVGGCVLTEGKEGEATATEYYISFPSDEPRVYTEVAKLMANIPVDEGQHTRNTYGQFGVMRKEGPSGLSFFVKDWGDFFFISHAGASCCSKEKIFVHVCELVNGMWHRHVSPPYDVADGGLFHRNAYSVLHGDMLYMMYLVASIDCLDLVSKKFSKIYLPAIVRERTRSWTDYTVCHHSKRGLALVQYWAGNLETWVLMSTHEGGCWMLESSKNLLQMFNPRLPMGVVAAMFSAEDNPHGRDPFNSIQLRSASPNARFVLLTLGFAPYLCMVDTEERRVFKIAKAEGDANVGRAYAMTEQWPPKM